jgi:sugar phosphate isomerase/epimerase
MTASFLDRQWEEALDAASQNGIAQIEACAGGHIPKRHFDPVELSTHPAALRRFRESLDSRALRLVALSCHGNPLDPDAAMAEACHRDFVATCALAAQLDVRDVNLLAGCPGGGPGDHVPNWIIPSLVPDFRDAYRWQWETQVLPYWTTAAAIATDHRVRICIEPHPATVVYNLETFDRLRNCVGPVIGMNWDHSHLWWQGIDPLTLIDDYADSIFTVHIKDTLVRHHALTRAGVLSAADHYDVERRPWYFSTPGVGHTEHEWARIVHALRANGYHNSLSIECEDPRMRPEDTLAKTVELLQRIVPDGEPPAVNWAAVAIQPRDSQ